MTGVNWIKLTYLSADELLVLDVFLVSGTLGKTSFLVDDDSLGIGSRLRLLHGEVLWVTSGKGNR